MISEKLRRLRQMSAPEVKFRLAQRWRIQKEQWGLATNGAGSNWTSHWNPAAVQHTMLRERLEAGDAVGAAALLPAYFAHRKGVTFFFDPAQRNEICVAHARSFPERLVSLQAEAEKICAHRFRIFAYPKVSAGPRIAWRRDLVHGKEAPVEHWARVPYLDFERAGDSKIVWEPNRHQHFVTLSQAYFLTGEEKYAQECCEQWDDWLRENPRGCGINWSSSLELAFRLWSWCWTLHFLQGSAALSGERWAAISQSIAQHTEFIQQNLSTYFSPNTHLLGEGFALFVIGLMYPELHGAAEWREAGRAVLLEQMEKQVRADGWHIEQSSYYHRYAVDFFQCAAILAERNRCPFPASFTAKLARMYEVILHMQLPSGSQAMLGDADGGRLLPFSSPPAPEHTHDQRGALSTAALYFSRPDFRAAAGALHEDTFWLLGASVAERWHELPAVPPGRASRVFREAGCVVMRATGATGERALLFDAGPQGLAGCAHGHADALSFVCSADGEDWLVDPGTFVYTGSREWRQSFSATRAHNTVVVDGRDQAEPVDIFKWTAIPNVRLEKWRTSPSLDVAVASHDGYLRLERGVIHRRRIVFVKPRFWLITDELNGAGEHIAEFLFHFAPQTKLAQSGRKCAASRGEKPLLLAASADTLAWETLEGDEGRRTGWYSADYGHRVAAPIACAKVRFTDSLRVDWLLAPGALASDYDVLSSTDGISVRGSSGETTMLAGSVVKGEALSSDAEYLLHAADTQGRTTRVTLLNGCCVSARSSPLLAAESMLDVFEAVQEDDSLHFFAQPMRRFRYFAPGVGNVTCNGKPAAVGRKGDWIEVAPN